MEKSFLDPRDFGASGDDLIDDTISLQKTFDAAIQYKKPVEFSPGQYIVEQVTIRPGLKILGHGAVLKRKSNMGKWSRMLVTYTWGLKTESVHSEDFDSDPIEIYDLNFDGSRLQQGPYQNYELEQQHMIVLMGDKAKSGRIRAIIKNCNFNEGAADGVSILNNVDVVLENISAKNVFRGGIVSTGGYSKISIENYKSLPGDILTGIDFETDGLGYKNSLAVEVTAKNLDLDGDFDFAVGPSSQAHLTQVISRKPPFNLSGKGTSVIYIDNSKFAIGLNNGASNRIVFPGKVLISNTQFLIDLQNSQADFGAALDIWWNLAGQITAGSANLNQLVQCTGCTFAKASATQAVTYGVRSMFDKKEFNNRLVIQNSKFEGLDYAIFQYNGGRSAIAKSILNTRYVFKANGSQGYYYQLFYTGPQTGTAVLDLTNLTLFPDRLNLENSVFVGN